MLPTRINGLPAHVLLVHLVIAAVPLAAGAVVLVAVWPVARRRIGVVAPLLALVALAVVPVTTHAGEWLQQRLGHTAAIDHHAALGGELLPWVAALFVVAVVQWAWGRHQLRQRERDATAAPAPVGGGGGTALAVRTRSTTGQRVVSAVLAVAAVVVAAGSVWMLYRIGDSGAQAVWKGVV